MAGGAVPHIFGKNGHIIKVIKGLNGVLIGIQDLDKSHALVPLFGPPTTLPQTKQLWVVFHVEFHLF